VRPSGVAVETAPFLFVRVIKERDEIAISYSGRAVLQTADNVVEPWEDLPDVCEITVITACSFDFVSEGRRGALSILFDDKLTGLSY